VIISTDISLQRWWKAHQSPFLRKISAMLSCLGSGYVWLLAYSLLFIFGAEQIEGYCRCGCLGGAAGPADHHSVQELHKKRAAYTNRLLIPSLAARFFPVASCAEGRPVSHHHLAYYPVWLPYFPFSCCDCRFQIYLANTISPTHAPE